MSGRGDPGQLQSRNDIWVGKRGNSRKLEQVPGSIWKPVHNPVWPETGVLWERSSHRKEDAKVGLRKLMREFQHYLRFSIEATRYGKTDVLKSILVVKKCKEITTLKVRMIVYLGRREGLWFGTWHLEGLLVWLTIYTSLSRWRF